VRAENATDKKKIIIMCSNKIAEGIVRKKTGHECSRKSTYIRSISDATPEMGSSRVRKIGLFFSPRFHSYKHSPTRRRQAFVTVYTRLYAFQMCVSKYSNSGITRVARYARLSYSDTRTRRRGPTETVRRRRVWFTRVPPPTNDDDGRTFNSKTIRARVFA